MTMVSPNMQLIFPIISLGEETEEWSLFEGDEIEEDEDGPVSEEGEARL